MKYSRADYIRLLVYNLDQSWEMSNYVAAIKESDHEKNEWSVYLYSRGGYGFQLIHLAAFALAITHLANDIHYSITEYNRATEGEDLVQAIKIW